MLNDKMRDELTQCFEMMDVDGSGSIDADELLAAMALIGLKAPREELLELINSVDTNRTGSLELAEFLELMTKHILVAEVKASNDFKVSMMIRRPVVLDTFPLVARSFDVHSTVARGPQLPQRRVQVFAVRTLDRGRQRRGGRQRERRLERFVGRRSDEDHGL